MKTLLTAAICAVLAVSALAADNPMAAHWKTAGDYTIAIAEQMPAEFYSFKPVPEEMSFAEQLLHIAKANTYFLSTLTGDKFADPPATFDKDSVLKYLRASFDWSNAEIAKLTPEEMQKSYPLEGQSMSGHEVLMLAWNHTTHHRGQLIVYLRLKGIKPTDYRF
jgi:uncharacterized damage-inducible protein DinB